MSNGDNDGVDSLSELATDIASAIPSIDAETEGQYGAGLGSESEERQIDLILNFLAEQDTRYSAVEREVTYPDRTAGCDIVLSDGLPRDSVSYISPHTRGIAIFIEWSRLWTGIRPSNSGVDSDIPTMRFFV